MAGSLSLRWVSIRTHRQSISPRDPQREFSSACGSQMTTHGEQSGSSSSARRRAAPIRSARDRVSERARGSVPAADAASRIQPVPAKGLCLEAAAVSSVNWAVTEFCRVVPLDRSSKARRATMVTYLDEAEVRAVLSWDEL